MKASHTFCGPKCQTFKFCLLGIHFRHYMYRLSFNINGKFALRISPIRFFCHHCICPTLMSCLQLIPRIIIHGSCFFMDTHSCCMEALSLSSTWPGGVPMIQIHSRTTVEIIASNKKSTNQLLNIKNVYDIDSQPYKISQFVN